jgi:hypothetical protein
MHLAPAQLASSVLLVQIAFAEDLPQILVAFEKSFSAGATAAGGRSAQNGRSERIRAACRFPARGEPQRAGPPIDMMVGQQRSG